MAKRPPVTKTLRPAPCAPQLAQWIAQGAPPLDDSTPQRPDDLTTQQSDDLTIQRSDKLALQAAQIDMSSALKSTNPAKSLVQRKDGQRRQVTYYIGPRRALELKLKATERGTTMMALVSELIERWLQDPSRLTLPSAEALREDQHLESGPALIERADGTNRYRINAYLEPERANAFKLAALRQGQQMSYIVDGLIAIWLSEHA